MRHLLFLLLLGWCELSWAQHWKADWQTEGIPSASSWRYDREAFYQAKGTLHLAIPDAMSAGRISLMTNLDLPSAPCWKGTLHLGLQPTSSNHPLILLCATEALSDTSYEYLVLDFGGQTARSVSLVRVQATRTVGTPQITWLSDHPPLITSPQLLLAGQDLAFRLIYAPKTGWQLYLKDLANDRDFILVGESTSYLPQLTLKNSFGISCRFTAKGRRAWSFRDFSLIPASDLAPNPLPPPEKEPTPIQPTLLLSEVMAHPKANAPEYVELYNASDSPCTLADYTLYAGSDEEHLHRCRLPEVAVPARSYVVLAQSSSSLRISYPQLPTEALLVEVDLPRLPNKSGVLYLTFGESEQVDQMSYATTRLPRGLKSKAGIAWERKSFQHTEDPTAWQPASSRSGYATPGLPASTEDKDSEKGGSGKSLEEHLHHLQQDRSLTCSWEVYSLRGERLAEGMGTMGKETLLELSHAPEQFFRTLLGAGYREPILLRLKLHPLHGEEEVETYLLRYHPR